MGKTAEGMDYCEVEWVNHGTLRWFEHVMWMEDDILKRIYKGKIEGKGVRERLSVRWINRVYECWRERRQMRD